MPAPGPTNLSRTAYWNRMYLHWASVSGAPGYRLRRKIQGASDANLVLIYEGRELNYTDFPAWLDYTTSSNSERSWTWDLVAYNDDGEGSASVQHYTFPGASNSDISGLEILHPSYNDGSDQTASYSDISKSGTGGASDSSANEALVFHENLWTASI